MNKSSTKIEKMKVGVLGCGAIGSRMAQSIKNDLKHFCVLSGIFDVDEKKTVELSKRLSLSKIIKQSLKDLLADCDLIVEAINALDTRDILQQVLNAKKSVLVMSVGKLLDSKNLFQLANKNGCHILIPSGAIAGIDAIKAASLAKIKSITLTTRKPPGGFVLPSEGGKKKVDFADIKKETVLYDGGVAQAVKLFPKNINVAATIALACGVEDKLRVRIITSPQLKTNSHEVEVIGDFGKISSRTDNEVCPDNPKTSYLAVLSAMQTLKQFFEKIKVGT